MISTLNSITEARPGAPNEAGMAKRETKSVSARPRKVAPDHPGIAIGHILDDVGLSIREAATMMGVSHNALANLVKGQSAISPEMAVRLQAFMGNGDDGAEFWLRLQAEYDVWHARQKLRDEIARIEPAPREPKVA